MNKHELKTIDSHKTEYGDSRSTDGNPDPTKVYRRTTVTTDQKIISSSSRGGGGYIRPDLPATGYKGASIPGNVT